MLFIIVFYTHMTVFYTIEKLLFKDLKFNEIFYFHAAFNYWSEINFRIKYES